MSTGERWRLGHRPALDGLRGIAVLLVVAAHAFPGLFPSTGVVGVAAFFTLSGFLITSILLDEHDRTGGVDLRAFYVRRGARLFPALACFLAFALTLMVFIGPRFGEPLHVLAAVFYVGNWLPATGHGMSSIDHTWTLAVEEQFYIFFPIALVPLVGRVSTRRLLAITASAATASAAWRLWLAADEGVLVSRVYNATDTNACLLLIGCATAMAVRLWPPRLSRAFWALVPVALMFNLGLSTDPFFVREKLSLVVSLATALALVLIVAAPDNGALTARWLVKVGQRSYALYLWHFLLTMTVADVIYERAGWPRAYTIPFLVASSWWLACLSWRYVEAPIQRRARAYLATREPAARSRP